MLRRIEQGKYDTSTDRVDHLLAGDYSLAWARLQGLEATYFATCAEDDVQEATSLPNVVWNLHMDDEWFEIPASDSGLIQPDSSSVALLEHLEGMLDWKGRLGGRGSRVGCASDGDNSAQEEWVEAEMGDVDGDGEDFVQGGDEDGEWDGEE